MTLREKQSELKKKGLPWERAKSFKHAAVFSDFITSLGGGDNYLDWFCHIFESEVVISA